MKKSKNATSKYLGVHYDTNRKRWVIWIERHPNHPAFTNERDAGIYAEYCYRGIYGTKPNFPKLSDAELSEEYQNMMERREVEMAERRSTSKQGLKKAKTKTSQYVGVCLGGKGTRWISRIQRFGVNRYIASFSINKYENAEELAARAYDKKALELCEKPERLNFKDS